MILLSQRRFYAVTAIQSVFSTAVYSALEESPLCHEYSSPFTNNRFSNWKDRTSLLDTAGSLDNDPNASAWEESLAHIKSISADTYSEICTLYKTNQILCIDIGLDSILKYKLHPASYATLVIAGVSQNNSVCTSEIEKLFSFLDCFLEHTGQVDTFVFYGIGGITRNPKTQRSIKSTSKDRKDRNINIVFHSTDTSTYTVLAHYFIDRFESVSSTIVCNDKGICELNQVDDTALSTVVQVKITEGSAEIDRAVFRKMVNLYSVWITEYILPVVPNRLTEDMQSSGTETDPIRVRRLYVPIDILKYYTLPSFSLFFDIVPTERLTLLIDSPRSIQNPILEVFSLKTIISCDSDGIGEIELGFGLYNGNSLTPDIMSGIMAVLCRLDKKNLRVYIENLAPQDRTDQSVMQLPLYYLAKRTEDMKKLESCRIVVSSGQNRTDVHVRPAPQIKFLKEEDRAKVLSQCTIVIESFNLFSSLNNTSRGLFAVKPLPRCLRVLYRARLTRKIECIHCKKVFIGTSRRYTEYGNMRDYIMMYPCGHVSCAICGYKHVSNGFKKIPACTKCSQLLDGTMIYILGDEAVGKPENISLCCPENPLVDALDYSQNGFVFLYGSGDSPALFDIGKVLVSRESPFYEWNKSPVERSLSYLASASGEHQKYTVNINHKKQKIAIVLNVYYRPHGYSKAVIYIRKRGIVHANRTVQNMYRCLCAMKNTCKYKELLPNENTSEFVFLYKRKYSTLRNTEIFYQLEKDLKEKMNRLATLCSVLWKGNGWS